ncbi:hypothetical protein MRX96_052810 [Rhipicephalus microplus]|uniref:Putative conserved secreted protein salivary gland overexpressed n=1 Tax=Rhipicephalus microplus TaxID=6941 RepID=A0A6M2D0M1_RHIMP
MGVLNVKVIAVVSFAFIVVVGQSEKEKFTCGPYCPEQGQTYASCVTVCENDGNPISDPFGVKTGRFRNGTLCWLDQNVSGRRGVCCGGECVENSTCKSMMHKCALRDEIRRNATLEKQRRDEERSKKEQKQSQLYAL